MESGDVQEGRSLSRRIGRGTLSILARLDTIIAAALVTLVVGNLPTHYVCEEILCRSAVDTAVQVAFAALAGVGALYLLWRFTHRGWSRALTLPSILYLNVPVPTLVHRFGRWTIHTNAAEACRVRVGATRNEVQAHCARPTYWCEGPKFVESNNLWVPFAFEACAFSGDVYGDRLIAYDCDGRVAYVEGFDGGPPEQTRPTGCVQWGR